MDKPDLHLLSISDLIPLIQRQEISPVDVTRAYLDRIGGLNKDLGAFITIMSDQALSAAEEAERTIHAGEQLGSLHGVPIAIKDIIHTRGVLTSAGS